jgi:hypothetical protein
MNIHEAVRLLRDGGEFSRLYEAIIAVAKDRTASLDDLMFGLQHPGVIREQGAFELYSRTARPLPREGRDIVTSREDWQEWLRTRSMERTA